MILVTGGAGFIGSNFIHHLWESGSRNLICLDALTYAGNLKNLDGLNDRPNFHFIKGDIQDQNLVTEIFKKHKPKTLVHFAAETHVDRSISGPDVFLKTNILGTFNLLQCALAYLKTDGADKDFRMIHISTDEVFGSLDLSDPAFTETTPYAPNSPYSASKASADHFVRAFHHTYQLPTITVNCSNNYGPHQFPEKLIPLVISNAVNLKHLPIYGTGTNVRDWLYVKDFCRAIELIALKGKVGATYNVGGGCEKTNIDVARAICQILDQKKPRKDGKSYLDLIQYVSDRPGHDFRYAVSFEKLKSELGWSPKETFESGIEKTIDWYLKAGSFA